MKNRKKVGCGTTATTGVVGRTDQEKIDLVKDLLQRGIGAMNKQFDEMMDKIEKEWTEEHG